ncbi:MAG: class I SAM-dependent methyltransferase, partial [Bdellovibrionota bacterium]
MKCYLCGSEKIEQIHNRCRDSAEVAVLRCTACGLVFLSDSKGISEKFYENSGMYDFAVPDRARLLAEEAADTKRRIGMLAPLVAGQRVLDFGCGAGAVIAGLKPYAADVSAVELNQSHRETIRRELGILVEKGLAEVPGSFDWITLFHVLEHLKDPVGELAKIRTRLAPGGKVLVEVPHANDALLSYYNVEAFKDFTYWTCHLYLFT